MYVMPWELIALPINAGLTPNPLNTLRDQVSFIKLDHQIFTFLMTKDFYDKSI